MSRHKTWIAGTPEGEGPHVCQGCCACGAKGPVVDYRWEADDWCIDHMQQVERALTHLWRTPSLKSSRDYYRRMAKTTDNPTHRQQWTMLADEIDMRLGNFDHDVDAPLW